MDLFYDEQDRWPRLSGDEVEMRVSRTDKHLLFGVIIGATGMWAVGVGRKGLPRRETTAELGQQ
jgi:hypothetical protein